MICLLCQVYPQSPALDLCCCNTEPLQVPTVGILSLEDVPFPMPFHLPKKSFLLWPIRNLFTQPLSSQYQFFMILGRPGHLFSLLETSISSIHIIVVGASLFLRDSDSPAECSWWRQFMLYLGYFKTGNSALGENCKMAISRDHMESW